MAQLTYTLLDPYGSHCGRLMAQPIFNHGETMANLYFIRPMVHIMEFWGFAKHKEMHPKPNPSLQLM
jgi:hypothetical protein